MPRAFEPILPYPSKQSLTDLILSMIEQSSGAKRPSDLEAYENYYLEESDIASCQMFQEIIGVVINGAEPAPWLLRALKEFEQTLAEYAIEALEAKSEGLDILNALRQTAAERSNT